MVLSLVQFESKVLGRFLVWSALVLLLYTNQLVSRLLGPQARLLCASCLLEVEAGFP
jgi:hypothetical protein